MTIKNNKVTKIIPPPPEKYEAYLYKITNLDNNKKYIGYKASPYDGTYFYSSECPIMKAELSKAEKIEYEILDYGYKIDMSTKETEMLQAVDAKNNSEYYNKSNGGGQYSIASFSDSDHLADSVLNHDLDHLIVNIPAKDLEDMDSIQVRAEEYGEHIKNITHNINDHYGDQDYINQKYQCVVLLDYNGKNNPILVGGNHTRKAVNRSKYSESVTIPTICIPKKMYKNLNIVDIHSLGLRLNPTPEDDHKPSGESDFTKHFLMRSKLKKIPVESKSNKDWLKEKFHKNSYQIGQIIKSAKKEEKKQNYKMAGKVWIDWTSKEWSQKLEDKLDQDRDKNTFTMAMSSGKFDWTKIISKIHANYPKKKNFILFIHHPSPDTTDYEETWFKKKYPAHLGEFKLIFSSLGIKYNIQYLATVASDGTKELEETE